MTYPQSEREGSVTYTESEKGMYIEDIFDCHQEPTKVLIVVREGNVWQGYP